MEKEQFIELFKETLEIEKDDVNFEDNFREFEEWDSLSILAILALVNELSDITIAREELEKIQTIGGIYDFIQSKQ